MISKKISYGVLDIEPESGRIWFNCPNCLIRIQNLRFNTIEEKFTMLDINGPDVTMVPGKLESDSYIDFLESITECVLPKFLTMSDDDKKDFLEKILLKIKGEINL